MNALTRGLITRPWAMERCHGWNWSHIFEAWSWGEWFWARNDGDLSHISSPKLGVDIWSHQKLENDWVEVKWDAMMWAIHLWKHSLLLPLAWAGPYRPSLLDCLVLSGIKCGRPGKGLDEWRIMEVKGCQGYLSQTPINISTVPTLTSP